MSISILLNLFQIPELHKRSNPGWRRGPRGSRTLAADVPEGRLIWRCPRPLHSKQAGRSCTVHCLASYYKSVSGSRVACPAVYLSFDTTNSSTLSLPLGVVSRGLRLRISWGIVQSGWTWRKSFHGNPAAVRFCTAHFSRWRGKKVTHSVKRRHVQSTNFRNSLSDSLVVRNQRQESWIWTKR